MRKLDFCGSVASVFALLLLWELIAKTLAIAIVPSPYSVFVKFTEIWQTELAMHTFFSAFRIFTAMAAALVVGYPLGVLAGYFKTADSLLSPLTYIVYPIPKVAFLPVVMLFFGVGETSKLVIIFLIVVFQVFVSVRDSVRSLPEEIFYPLRSLGAGFGDIFRHVVSPAIMPATISSLRIGGATAVSVLFFTETFGTTSGLGYFILDAWLRVSYEEMYAGIVVLGIMGLIMFLIADGTEKFLCRWQNK